MKIRKAKQSDISSLFALEKELFCSENYPLSRGSFSYHVKNNLLCVAEIDGKIAGYALVLVRRKTPKLYSIGVSQEYRKQKISQEMIVYLLKELWAMGFSNLLLEVRIDNDAAIALYKKIGFFEVKKLKAFYRDGCDAYLMELKYAGDTLQADI